MNMWTWLFNCEHSFTLTKAWCSTQFVMITGRRRRRVENSIVIMIKIEWYHTILKRRKLDIITFIVYQVRRSNVKYPPPPCTSPVIIVMMLMMIMKKVGDKENDMFQVRRPNGGRPPPLCTSPMLIIVMMLEIMTMIKRMGMKKMTIVMFQVRRSNGGHPPPSLHLTHDRDQRHTSTSPRCKPSWCILVSGRR